VKLCVFADMRQHNLAALLAAGLKATVNSDDPAYFGGYANDNYRAVSDALSLKRDEIVAIVRNGFHASLMDASAKDSALAEVDRVLANHA
jgi:adenosine deaminase